MIEARDFFNGKVKTLICDVKGEPFRVGVLLPGNYTFGTNCAEEIEIIQGQIEVALPDGKVKMYQKGESFSVEAERDYNLFIEKYPAAYLCKFK